MTLPISASIGMPEYATQNLFFLDNACVFLKKERAPDDQKQYLSLQNRIRNRKRKYTVRFVTWQARDWRSSKCHIDYLPLHHWQWQPPGVVSARLIIFEEDEPLW